MADGGYIFDEELDQNFLDWEKYNYFCLMGANEEAFRITTNVYELSDEKLTEIIERYKNEHTKS